MAVDADKKRGTGDVGWDIVPPGLVVQGGPDGTDCSEN